MLDEEERKSLALASFEEDVRYIQKYVAPDDIYLFCQHALNAAYHFIEVLSTLENLDLLAEKNHETFMHMTNVIKFLRCQQEKIEIDVDLSLEARKK